MNRVYPPQSSAHNASVSSSGSSLTVKNGFRGRALERRGERPASGGRSPLSFYSPVHYEQNYAYPLVVWLHDDGGNEQQLRQVAPLISLRNYVAVAVRGTAPSGGGQFRWQTGDDGLSVAIDVVDQALAAARQRFHIHPERVFLAGLGGGGTMAVRAALQTPHLFAGAASVGGPLPRGDRPLRFLNQARRLPLWLAYHQLLGSFPAQQMREDLRLLHAAGMSVALQLYPADDGLTREMLSDLDGWMMGRVCRASATVVS